MSSRASQTRRTVTRRARRLHTYLAGRLDPADDEPLIVFGVGCQRSGTTMLGETIDRSLDTWVFQEHDRRAFHAFRLRTADVDRLARWSRRPVAVFKSIADAQWTDRFLERHPGSKAIWIYRRYPDVARSAIAKWGDHQRWVVESVRQRAVARLEWRGERLADHVVDTIDRVHRPDLTVEEGAALFWWMRNSILWDRDLADDGGVLIVRYEDLVLSPAPSFQRVFDFLGVGFRGDYVADITPRSVHPAPLDRLSVEIRELCDEMLARLDLAHEASTRRHPARGRDVAHR